MLRQLQLPLAAIKELLACDPADAATRIAEHWRDAEAAHDARRDLADYLVSRFSGKRSVMYEVATRDLVKRYGSTMAVNHLSSFSIRPGDLPAHMREVGALLDAKALHGGRFTPFMIAEAT